MSGSAVIRFAPSPNGELHLGHAFSALLAYRTARDMNARFLLRIEDIDLGRCRPEFEAQMLDDLAWLGLQWEEPVRRQSAHFDFYRQALRKLDALGLLYPCWASRKAITEAYAGTADEERPHDPDGALIYPGLYKGLAKPELARKKTQGEPFALRLDMARAIELAHARCGGAITFKSFEPGKQQSQTQPAAPARWGDAVIARKDVPTSYHLAVVADDAAQGITHIVRGEDLLAATDIHRLLQILLDLPAPLYHHHGLVRDEEGRKLSKSHGDKSLKSLRAGGASPQDIARMVDLDG